MLRREISLFEKAMAFIDCKEYETAHQCLRKAIKDGDADAMFQLGLMYWEGQGVEPDLDEAIALIKEAKENGHPVADFYYDIITAYKECLEESSTEYN